MPRLYLHFWGPRKHTSQAWGLLWFAVSQGALVGRMHVTITVWTGHKFRVRSIFTSCHIFAFLSDNVFFSTLMSGSVWIPDFKHYFQRGPRLCWKSPPNWPKDTSKFTELAKGVPQLIEVSTYLRAIKNADYSWLE